MNDKIKGLLRHVLTFAGGYLVTQGIIDEQTLTEIVGHCGVESVEPPIVSSSLLSTGKAE